MEKCFLIVSYFRLFVNVVILLIEMKSSFSQIINNIIRLGGQNFRYNHFSENSKGDMVIDTTAYPGNNERRFFGLKRNGRGFFFDENNIETPYRSLFAENLENENMQKIEGESNFIILSRQNSTEIIEYLISFSKLDSYMEIYDFESNKIIAKKSSEIFKNAILSDSGSFIKSKSPIDNVNNYYIAYIYYDTSKNEYRFYLVRCYFTSTDFNNKAYHKDTGSGKSAIFKSMTSCFETETLKIVCFYQKSKTKEYTILAFNDTYINATSQNYTYLLAASNDTNLFYKAIHFKKEIGVFIYYLSIDDTYPIASIKNCNHKDNRFYNYKNYGEINLNKKVFNSNALMNDIIKLDDNKICFISISNNKNSLIIVIFNFYNQDNYMKIRYYSYDMYNNYGIKFFNDLRIFSFHGFISVAFSHCPQSQCSDYFDLHYSSLIIFNYPNITADQNINLLEYIYRTNNKFEDYNFILHENLNCNIENNIFGYSCKGIKILNYPENTTLKYKSSNNDVEKNSFLTKNENLFLFFEERDEYEGMNYTIEYAFVVIEPEYSQINTYISDIDNSYGNEIEENYYEKNEFIGKSAYFNLTIEENLTSICNDKCSLCYMKNINYCVTCKYNYTFNNNEKICFEIIESTIPLTTILTPSMMTTNLFTSTFLTITTEIQTTVPNIIHTTNLITPKTTLFSSTIITLSSLISTTEFLETTSPIESTNLKSKYSTIITISSLPSTNLQSEYSTILSISTIALTNLQSEYLTIITTSSIESTNFQMQFSAIIAISPTILSTNFKSESPTIISSQISSTNIITESPAIFSTFPTILSTNFHSESLKIITSQIKSTIIITESSVILSTSFQTESSIIISSQISSTIINNEYSTLFSTSSTILSTNFQSESSIIITSQISSTIIITESPTIFSTNFQSESPKIITSQILSTIFSTEFTRRESSISTIIVQSENPGLKPSFKIQSSIINSYNLYSSNLINNNHYFSTNPFKNDIISNSIVNIYFKCTKQEIIFGKCSDYIENAQIEDVNIYIKENVIKQYNNSNSSLIIETKNVIFQVSTVE